MAEGSLYDRGLAALAIKQARGDLIEAIFLLRAYRTTLPRFGYSAPLETQDMLLRRRVSAVFKDLPGGQILGPTFDYTHRLLDFDLESPGEMPDAESFDADVVHGTVPRITDLINNEDGMIEPDVRSDPEVEPDDLTREPLAFPADRSLRLQALARGDEGFLLALGYSTQRGYARTHPFAGEIRFGMVEVEFFVEELGFAVTLGRVSVTECQMVTQFRGTPTQPAQFTRGYGLVFGQSERKSMSMALVDRALRRAEFDEDLVASAQDEEFVLSHCDNIQATGFIEHLKLPHYVDFQAELELLRKIRRGQDERNAAQEAAE